MGDGNSGASPVKLVLTDDHPFVLMGLRLLLESHGFNIADACGDGVRALAAVREHRPDVLILDLQMPGLDGVAVMREVQREKLPTRVIVLAAGFAPAQVASLKDLGARAILRKTEAPERLVQCVRDVHAGGTWLEVPRAEAPTVDLAARRQQLASLLTQREIEIVEMIARALPNKVIAQKLGIAEGTVKLHLHRVYDKLKLRGRMDLLLYVTERPAETH